MEMCGNRRIHFFWKVNDLCTFYNGNACLNVHVNCKFDSHFRVFVGNLIPAYRGARRRHKFHVLIEVIQSNIALKNIFHFVHFVQITFQKWVLNNILQFIRLLFRKNTKWNPLSNTYFRSVFFPEIS